MNLPPHIRALIRTDPRGRYQTGISAPDAAIPVKAPRKPRGQGRVALAKRAAADAFNLRGEACKELYRQMAAAGVDVRWKTPGKMSGWEKQYAERLRNHQLARLIIAWEYEPFSVAIGPGARFTPDFFVWMADGVQIVEVKGYRYAAGIVRAKVFAGMYPQWPLSIATKVQGEWVVKRVETKGNR